MVMPKLPFSLFDFNHINKFGPITKTLGAAAGADIATNLYTIPPFKFALILSVSVESVKTTSTRFEAYITRKAVHDSFVEHLIDETLGSTEHHASWPPAKAPATWIMAWHLLLMFPGDVLSIRHALTAAETIIDDISVSRIEYNDPRYEKE